MKKAGKVLGSIWKVLLVLLLIFSVVYLALCSLDENVENSFSLIKGSFGVNPVWKSDAQETPIDEIYDKYGSNSAVATYEIYNYICKKIMLTDAYGTRAKSVIRAWVGDSYESATISADVTNNTSHQFKNAGTPTLNANQKIYHSYTNSVYVIDCNQDSVKGPLKKLVKIGNRYYSNGEKTYIQKGSLSVMEDGDEVFNWSDTYSEEVATVSRVYADSDIRDLDNFIVNRNTIVADSCVIDRKYSEEYSMYEYTVKFSLDCSDSGEGSATYYEVKAIGDVLGSFMKDLYYDQLDIELHLFSNGYLLTRNMIQNWTIAVNLFGLEGHAKSELVEVYNYRESECKIVDFTK